MTRTFTLALLVLVTMSAHAEPAPATRPARHRLLAQAVHGATPRQWVFVVVGPTGFAGVTTPEYLRRYIEIVVPAGSVLEWSPDCCTIGGEPLRTAEETTALADFCKQRKITFVVIPAG